MNADLMVAIATFLLVLATAGAALFSLRGIRDQLWLMTFAEYTKRYSAIVDGLPTAARNPTGNYDLETGDPSERERVLVAYRRYLNLCSEELYLHTRRMLDHQTWGIWTTGIRDTARSAAFRSAWTRLKTEYAYYPDFCDFMDGVVSREKGQ